MLFDYTPTVNGEEFSHGQEMESSIWEQHTHNTLKIDAIFLLFATTCAHLQMTLSLQMSVAALLLCVLVFGATQCVQVRVTLPLPVKDTQTATWWKCEILHQMRIDKMFFIRKKHQVLTFF